MSVVVGRVQDITPNEVGFEMSQLRLSDTL